MKYDFISIGDVTTDAFIRLKEASVHCDINRENCVICMAFASKIPYEDVIVVPGVGNSANAAVAAARLGLKSAFASNVGDDDFGKETIAALKKEGVETAFIKSHPGRKTNYHYVLWYEDERTILVKHEDYPYDLPDIDNPKWIYFSSIGENSLSFHAVVAEFLRRNPDVKFAFQPGTFQIKFGTEALAAIYQRTDVFIANKEEYKQILKTDETDIKKLMRQMQGLGPKTAVLTDGREGAYAANGKNVWFMPIYPDPKPPYERTGAGDAFSSTFVAALALDMSVGDALRWAPVNAMSVVQKIGAREGLLTSAEIEDYLRKAPSDYKPKEI